MTSLAVVILCVLIVLLDGVTAPTTRPPTTGPTGTTAVVTTTASNGTAAAKVAGWNSIYLLPIIGGAALILALLYMCYQARQSCLTPPLAPHPLYGAAYTGQAYSYGPAAYQPQPAFNVAQRTPAYYSGPYSGSSPYLM
jgi:hypothetical protein